MGHHFRADEAPAPAADEGADVMNEALEDGYEGGEGDAVHEHGDVGRADEDLGAMDGQDGADDVGQNGQDSNEAGCDGATLQDTQPEQEMDDTLEAMKAVSEDGDIVPEKVLEALEDDSHPLAKPNDSESDPKSLQEMIQSMETADESQGSLGPNSPIYKRAYTTKQVEEMMEPSYKMIFEDGGMPLSASPAEMLGSSPEVLSIASTPTPVPSAPRPSALRPSAFGPPSLRRGKHIEPLVSDHLSPEQKNAFIELCKQKLQSFNDFTSHAPQLEKFCIYIYTYIYNYTKI